ncbi:MAG: hypothetical protein ACI8RD_007629 [Bacillariaceae sp.]|jgi:hypothetical protein
MMVAWSFVVCRFFIVTAMQIDLTVRYDICFPVLRYLYYERLEIEFGMMFMFKYK